MIATLTTSLVDQARQRAADAFNAAFEAAVESGSDDIQAARFAGNESWKLWEQANALRSE